MQPPNDAEKHLERQFEKFELLWSCKADSQYEFAQLFEFVHEWAFEQRKAGRDTSMQEYARMLQPDNFEKMLHRGFNSKTSVGACGVPLQTLKRLPAPVLTSLAAIVLEVIHAIVSPGDGVQAMLDLTPEKSGGNRSVASFASIWRICNHLGDVTGLETIGSSYFA